MQNSCNSSENWLEPDDDTDDYYIAFSAQHSDDDDAALTGASIPSASAFASRSAVPAFHSPLSRPLVSPSPTKRPRLSRPLPGSASSSSKPPKRGRVFRHITKRPSVHKPSGRPRHPSKPAHNPGHAVGFETDYSIPPKSVAGSEGAGQEPDPDSGLDIATMISRLRDGSNDYGSVTRQFLPKGSVVATSAGVPDGGIRPATQAASAASLLSETSPLAPPTVSGGSIWSPADGSLSDHSSPTSSVSTALQDIGVIELLEQDDRPTFVVDLANTANFRPGPLQITYSNPALQSRPYIASLLSVGSSLSPPESTTEGSNQDQDALLSFKSWLLTYADSRDTAADPPAPTAFAGLQWSHSTLRRRFRVVRASISGNYPPFSNTPVVADDALAKLAALPIPLSSPVSLMQDATADHLASWSRDSAIAAPTSKPPEFEEDSTTLAASADGPPEETGDYFGDTSTSTLSVDTGGLSFLEKKTSVFAAEQLRPSFDWTRINLTDDLPPHILFARSVNWAATPLGPIAQWPAALRTMANMVMGSPNPSVMYWGPEFTTIYNEAYVALAGKKHPQLMGTSYPVGWPEFWEVMQPIFHSAWNAGQAILKHDDRFFLRRNGYLEETFFNWSIVPLVGDDGSVVALYNPAFDITRRKLNERRMLTLRELGEKTSTAQTVQSFWQRVQQGLEYNEYDVPFTLMYSVAGYNNDDSESDVSSMHSGTPASPPQVVLEGSLGVPAGHPTAVAKLDLRTSNEGFAPYMRQSMSTASSSRPTTLPSPVVLSVEDGSLPPALVAGLDQGHRGFGDAIRNVVVFPVYHRTPPVVAVTGESLSSTVAGFVVMGTNPRRAYDRDYRLFMHLLARQLTTSLAAVVLFEEEVRRNQRAIRRAAKDRQEMSQQLQQRTQEAAENENKFMRMAECTPVGMFVADARGRLTYCNDMWWAISRHPKATEGKAAADMPVSAAGFDELAWTSWMESVEEEDQPMVRAVWDRLASDQKEVAHEFRFKKKTSLTIGSPDDEDAETTEITTWVLLRAAPEKDEKTGELKGIFGCITDISRQKMAEEYQNQRREEAVEHKRQQENFIDLTSHEMRNPLSAILQSVDEINNTVEVFRAEGKAGGIELSGNLKDLLDSIYEASSTISLCANHQKRIVDDVLTLSKLDSMLLQVTPIDVQPISTLRSTLKMFEAEFHAHDIPCTFLVQPSFQKLIGTHTIVRLDPSRLSQILINMLTNAIKFTQASEHRSLVISLGASEDGIASCEDITDTDRPEYIPSSKGAFQMETDAGWGSGPKFNLHIAVSDTGKGLQEDERQMLFQRFSKASPRTHVRYGGSGLGLFICRNLVELQGGQIGVASRISQGSTFAFYVSCRKAEPEPEPGLAASAHAPPASVPYAPFVAYSVCAPSNQPSSCAQSVWVAPAASPTTASAARPSLRLSTTPMSVTPDSNSPVSTPLQDFPPVDVLVVEDNLVNQRVLQRQLNKSGNRTLVANHGAEALDALRQSCHWRDYSHHRDTAMEIDPVSPMPGTPTATSVETDMAVDAAVNAVVLTSPTPKRQPESSSTPMGNNISIILMDLEMPVMDGLTCARAIRALEEAGALVRHVPILAVTAYARREQIESAKAAGIDDVISKPFRLAELMPKIHMLVKKYQTL